MKSIRNLLGLCAIFFLSCNSPEPNAARVAASVHDHASELPAQETKWKSDSRTRQHVENLSSQIKSFGKQGGRQEVEYQALALKLQTELNALITDCKMKGPEHEALHSWLEPVLEKVKELKNPGSPSQKAETVKQLEMQVNKFNQYFN